MPITENILNHQLIGPAYRKGRQEGRETGRQEGALTILRRQIAKRFGPIPDWLEERLAHSSVGDLELLSDRVLDARTLDDLVK